MNHPSPEMYCLQPNGAVPHPLEPRGILGARGGALETPRSLPEVGGWPEAIRPVEGSAGLRRGEPAPEKGPRGTEDIARWRHIVKSMCV